MPIDIQPPNLSGLAAIAGGNGQLNIAPTGALGLQALQLGNQRAASLRDNAMQRAQLGQQGLLQLRQQNLMRDQMAQQGLLAKQGQQADAAKMAMQGNQFQQSLGMQQQELAQKAALGQAGLDIEKQKLEADNQSKMMAKLMDMDSKKIHQQGAFAASMLVSMKNAKTPEEANMIRSQGIQSAVDEGYMTEEQAAQYSKMPLSQVNNELMKQVYMLGSIKEFKTGMDATKEQSKSGTHIEFNEDGSIRSVSSDPTNAVKSDTMKDLKEKEMDLNQLANIRSQFDPKQLTYAGRAGRASSALAEVSRGIPVLGQVSELLAGSITGQSPEDRGKALEKSTAYINSVEQYFNKYRKEITGAAAADKELARLRESLLNKDMSPSEFKGSLDQLVKRITGEADYNKKILREGQDLTPQGDDKLRQFYKQNGKTDAEIDEYFRSKK